MSQPAPDEWLVGFAGAASLAAWVYLVTRWQRSGELLAYEPRGPVPWGPIGSLLAITFAVLSISSSFGISSGDAVLSVPLSNLVQYLVVESLFVGGFLFAVAATSLANRRDLGLPRNVHGYSRDLWIGVVVCLVALLPVYGLLYLLVHVFDLESHHSLVETVLREKNFAALAVAFVSAVIVAPICEEISFRLLLQGWLEKWVLRWSPANREFPPEATSPPTERIDVAEVAASRTTSDEPTMTRPLVAARSSFLLCVPILLSSTLFALAHFGQGAAPAALFILAAFLGYTYQRMHRIVPCIVAHSLFNLLSILALWLEIMFPSE